MIHRGRGIYALFICGCNIHLFLKLRNRKLQEEANEISLCQFSKMSRWVEITSTPTSQYWEPYSRIEDYGLKLSIMAAITGADLAERPIDTI